MDPKPHATVAATARQRVRKAFAAGYHINREISGTLGAWISTT